MGYTDFVIEKSAISGKYQKVSLSSYCGFKRNDPILSTGKGFGNNRTVPPISYKRLSFSKRDLSTHWETVPFSNCCYFSSCSPQIHSKAIDFWIFSTQELRKENLFIPESEEGTAMMVLQSQTKQRQVTIDPKTSDVDNIRCFSERLGGPSTRNTKRGSMVKLGVTRTYQCTQIEIRKASHNDTYKNLQMDNMVALSYIKMIGGISGLAILWNIYPLLPVWKSTFSPDHLRTKANGNYTSKYSEWFASFQRFPISISLHQGYHISFECTYHVNQIHSAEEWMLSSNHKETREAMYFHLGCWNSNTFFIYFGFE